MAKIQESTITIKLSKLIKTGVEETPIVSETLCGDVEALVQELVGQGVIVETTQE
ncbi:hypothetical protein UFOVP116_369 [uncultured Caudovirales phage]|uniref:Uncharacterized protein n=1 Tax=uncultured Caudovirales phage TaxID=2100421 RepID=A0A6J5LF96_9CAUD|nr:hypothetical protein UFOVP116_369 [uncultured Caudovirales phage]